MFCATAIVAGQRGPWSHYFCAQLRFMRASTTYPCGQAGTWFHDLPCKKGGRHSVRRQFGKGKHGQRFRRRNTTCMVCAPKIGGSAAEHAYSHDRRLPAGRVVAFKIVNMVAGRAGAVRISFLPDVAASAAVGAISPRARVCAPKVPRLFRLLKHLRPSCCRSTRRTALFSDWVAACPWVGFPRQQVCAAQCRSGASRHQHWPLLPCCFSGRAQHQVNPQFGSESGTRTLCKKKKLARG